MFKEKFAYMLQIFCCRCSWKVSYLYFVHCLVCGSEKLDFLVYKLSIAYLVIVNENSICSIWCLILSGNVLQTMAITEEPLPIHTLHTCSIPPPLSATLWCMYFFTLSFHLTTDLTLLLESSFSLTYTFFTNLLLFHSIWPNYLNIFLFTFFHYTILHSICTSSHATLSLLTPSQITNFHSMHSRLLCPMPCLSLWHICQCWQENTVLYTSLYHHGHISSSHKEMQIK